MKNLKAKLPFFLRKPGAFISAAWILVLLILSFTGQFWFPWDPTFQDIEHSLELPTLRHWLGTDDLGRDIFARLFASGATSIYASLFVLAVSFGLGLPAALLAAERGGKVESFIGRFAEVIFALPATVMLLSLVGVVGTAKVEPVMIFFGFLVAPGLYRVMIGQVKSVRQRLYVDAARLNGLGSVRVNLRHVLPALYRFLAVQVAMIFSVSLLMQAGLSFLGIGPAEPLPSWGGMISMAQAHIYDSPWMMVPPGLVLIFTVLAANELADAIGAGEFEKPKNIFVGSFRKAREIAALASEKASQALKPAEGALLELRDLRVSVTGKHELVSGVSLQLKQGEVLGLVGESGCGKTMTALSLLGLLPAGVQISSGNIFFDGKDISAWSDKQLNTIRGSQISFISQEPMVALDPMFSVASQLMTPIRRFQKVGRSEARAIALDLLDQVGIQNPTRVMKSYPHQLSGGMAQRVAIALALTGKPKLLIADEPTTALDVTIQAEILDVLRNLVKVHNMSMIVVTHNLGVVADIADRVAVMYAGQIIESGEVSEVLEQPAHPYTSALLAADPHVPHGKNMPARLISIPGSVPLPATWTTSCRFAARCAFAAEVCKQPLVEVEAHGDGSVKCLRAGNLDLSTTAIRTIEGFN